MHHNLLTADYTIAGKQIIGDGSELQAYPSDTPTVAEELAGGGGGGSGLAGYVKYIPVIASRNITPDDFGVRLDVTSATLQTLTIQTDVAGGYDITNAPIFMVRAAGTALPSVNGSAGVTFQNPDSLSFVANKCIGYMWVAANTWLLF